jgi:hypothetical protein
MDLTCDAAELMFPLGCSHIEVLGCVFTTGLRFDDVEKRWRRLAVLPRERRRSDWCSTDSISLASPRFTVFADHVAHMSASREYAAEHRRIHARFTSYVGVQQRVHRPCKLV